VKIRTLEHLEDALDEELAWRLRELSVLRGQIVRAKGPAADMLVRAGVALLYAHFEGFVRGACEAYVEYVSRQGVLFERLVPGLRALGLRSRLHEASDAKTMRVWIPFIEHLEGARGKTMALPRSGAIRTQSNLSSMVLAEILMSLGIDFKPYELKQKLIDQELVDRRNKIAHGRFLTTGPHEFEELHNEVRGMMETLRGQVSNAAQLTEYRLATP
jgi:MAE_28990/MAE_18760-like HEPN